MRVLTTPVVIDRYLREQRATRRERITRREEASLRQALRQGFRRQESLLLQKLDSIRLQLTGLFEAASISEQGPGDDDISRLWDEVHEETSEDMANAVQANASSAFQRGSQVLASDLIVDVSFDLAHPRAVAYLEDRGANLIRGIDDTTRMEVRRIVSNGVRAGTSYDDLSQQLRDKFKQFHTPQPQLHIRDRAELIAVTEMGEAYEAGSDAIAKEIRDLGISIEKSWLTADDTRVDDPICRGNERQGWIPIEQAFQSGHQRPLGHPACRCTGLNRRRATR